MNTLKVRIKIAHLGFICKNSEIMYRPLKLSEVIGQSTAVQLLKNSLSQNKLPRTIIFHGPSGVGKTTMARIIAAWFVCENKEENDVCGKCESCLSVQKDAIPDIIEFDAASHTSIEDVRQILDQCKYAPQYSSEKVFIIDEAHMLSRNAIAALLKTFEETANHIRFILATTEIEKISQAIRSRCFCIPMQKMTPDLTKESLKNIAKKNNIECDEESLSIIAMASKGSMREANSIFEQAALLSSDKINKEKIYQILSFAPDVLVETVCDQIEKGEFLNLYNTLEEEISKQYDSIAFLGQVINKFKQKYAQENKEKTIKIMINLNKIMHECVKIAFPFDFIQIGMCEIANNNCFNK